MSDEYAASKSPTEGKVISAVDPADGEKIETDEPTQEEMNPPVGVSILEAQSEFMMAIMQIQSKYGLPSYMTNILVSSCISDIRDVVIKDLIASLSK